MEKAEHARDWLKANIDTSPDDYYNEQVKHVQHGIIIKGLIAADVHRFKKKERRNRNKLRIKSNETITTTIDLQTEGNETSNVDNNYNNKLSKNQ